ncbi:synaptic vesicle membrane protein VAT-1 homolog [Watersipora subatra]|uniref:synaptic vesicle membrane protein VAT-1 homolog n=1 Tax=Watersipora subatra TaxID=2589382 RepID=UPI00355B6C7A
MDEKSRTLMRRSLTLVSTKGEDNLVVKETVVPAVGEEDVMIDVKFCGLNFAEASMRQGLYAPMPPVPFVPGYECSGFVKEVGAAVKDIKTGDRVVALSDMGAWQDQLVLPQENCFVIPENMSLEDAAAIPVNYVTAAIMLFEQAVLKPGQSVFVHMAAGGVGTAVGQLCKTVPDVTVFGTASASKHEHCRAHGITCPIDYKTQDYAQVVKSSSFRGVDIMLDPVGGSDSSRSHSILKPLGKHIHYGGSSYVLGENLTFYGMYRALVNKLFSPTYDGFGLMDKNVMVGGLHVGKLVKDRANFSIVRRNMESLVELYQEGKIKPVIDSIYPFEEVKEAMARIYQRKNIGKILLRASPGSDGK